MTTLSRDALFFSGGVDSTLLLWELTRTPRHLTLLMVENTHYIPRALSIVSDHFPGTRVLTVPVDTKSGVIADAVLRALHDPEFDRVYTAVTQNPPIQLPGTAPVRITPNRARQINKLCTPYVTLTKDAVLQKYYDNGIEYLLPLTYSCTEDSVAPCMNCWQCNERMWAFKQLGREYQ
jgi:hypothetical protein